MVPTLCVSATLPALSLYCYMGKVMYLHALYQGCCLYVIPLIVIVPPTDCDATGEAIGGIAGIAGITGAVRIRLSLL